jgi:heme exporter protein D
MISDAVLIAIIVAVPAVLTSVVAPVLIAWQQHRNRLEEKREDRAREDEVAAKLQASQTLVSDRTDITNRKLDKIHVLVNSNMTAAMQSELDAKI